MTDSTHTAQQTLREIYQAGYEKSVAAMVDDIITEYKLRLEHGTKTFMYYKKWSSNGYFMSPIYTDGNKMDTKYNTIRQSDTDITKFRDDVYKQLTDQYGIFIHKFGAHYVDNKNCWHHLKFEIILSLDPSEENK